MRASHVPSTLGKWIKERYDEDQQDQVWPYSSLWGEESRAVRNFLITTWGKAEKIQPPNARAEKDEALTVSVASC